MKIIKSKNLIFFFINSKHKSVFLNIFSFKKAASNMKRLCRRSSMSGWPSGLRRQTQAIACAVSACRVFWSPIGGVGSNPTSDIVFFISSSHSSKSAPFEQLLTGSERKEHDF